jgi:tellurite resistance protein
LTAGGRRAHPRRMHEQDLAIVKALVPVAWADGEFAEQERETLDALLDAYNATDDEKRALKEYARQRRTLDEIELQELSADDRRVLLQHAVLLSFADGKQTPDEVEFLERLVAKLKIPHDEAKTVMASAAERAHKFLHLL